MPVALLRCSPDSPPPLIRLHYISRDMSPANNKHFIMHRKYLRKWSKLSQLGEVYSNKHPVGSITTQETSGLRGYPESDAGEKKERELQSLVMLLAFAFCICFYDYFEDDDAASASLPSPPPSPCSS